MTSAQKALRGLDALIGGGGKSHVDDNELVTPPDDGLPSALQELFGEDPEEPEPIQAGHKRATKGSRSGARDEHRGPISRVWHWARNVRITGEPGDAVGVNLAQVTPYLSAFASGFGGDDKDKDKDKDKERDRERQRLEKEKEAAESRSRTVLWVVLGTLVVGGLGTGLYFAARRKR